MPLDWVALYMNCRQEEVRGKPSIPYYWNCCILNQPQMRRTVTIFHVTNRHTHKPHHNGLDRTLAVCVRGPNTGDPLYNFILDYAHFKRKRHQMKLGYTCVAYRCCCYYVVSISYCWHWLYVCTRLILPLSTAI